MEARCGTLTHESPFGTSVHSSIFVSLSISLDILCKPFFTFPTAVFSTIWLAVVPFREFSFSDILCFCSFLSLSGGCNAFQVRLPGVIKSMSAMILTEGKPI